MRIFILGTGATGSLLAQFLLRQGHSVSCGDRDQERARRFLGKKSPIPLFQVNARNLRAVVRAAAGCHLLINAAPAFLNQITLRAALFLQAHYLDLASHLGRNPFKPEQLAYEKRFRKKNRAAVINAGVAPGLTNLLVARAAEMLDKVETARIRLFEETEGQDPISQWSAQDSFHEAVSRPVIYRDGRYHWAKRFGEREVFPFGPPIGRTPTYLAAQDEVTTLPRFIPMRELEAKIGGNEMARLRRWYRQGKLTRSRGLVGQRFPETSTPRQVARLIRRGVLHNARFAVAVVVQGVSKEQRIELRWDAQFPSLSQIRQRGLAVSPVAYATAQMAALFVKHFPRGKAGVFPPEALPAENQRAILSDIRSRSVRLTLKRKRLAATEENEEL